MLREILLAGSGGFVGSALRYCLSVLLPVSAGGFPTGTFTANALGSLLIGALIPVCRGSDWYFLCVTGLCGGFTTFSTFSAETVAFLQKGNCGLAALYAATSLAACLLATTAGWQIGSRAMNG